MIITIQLLLSSIVQMVTTILWLRMGRHAGCSTCFTPACCIKPVTCVQLGGLQLTNDVCCKLSIQSARTNHSYLLLCSDHVCCCGPASPDAVAGAIASVPGLAAWDTCCRNSLEGVTRPDPASVISSSNSSCPCRQLQAFYFCKYTYQMQSCQGHSNECHHYLSNFTVSLAL